MRNKVILSLLLLSLWSCQKEKIISICRVSKFVTDYPGSSLTHHDLFGMNVNRLEKIYSYDLRNRTDTINRQRIFFEYNALNKVTAIRDESVSTRIIRFEFVYENNEPVAKKVNQITAGVKNNEIIFEYDKQNRPIGALSLNLIGLNRSIEYDAKGNPFRVTRADFGNSPTINEHTFDDKRNFFEGIPEIGMYWLLRPLYNFIPFGSNNIIATKYYTVQNLEFKEVPDNRTVRETTYNEQGFPLTMSIVFENQGRLISTNSTFEYVCQ